MSGSLPDSFHDDYLYGLLAVRRGLITQAQLDEAVSIRIRSVPTPRLVDVLIELGRIPPGEVKSLTDQFGMLLFGSIASDLGCVTPSRIEEALDIQRRSSPRPLVGEVLVALGAISRASLRRILERQEEALSSALLENPTRKARRRLARQLRRRRIVSGAGKIPVSDSDSLHPWLGLAAGFAFLCFVGWTVSRPQPETGVEALLRDDGGNVASAADPRPDERRAIHVGDRVRETGEWAQAGNHAPAHQEAASQYHAGALPRVLTPAAPAAAEASDSVAPSNPGTIPLPAARPGNEVPPARDPEARAVPPADPSRFRVPWDTASWERMAGELDRMLASKPPPDRPVYYLGEDWRTQGTWMGRLGTHAYILAGMNAPFDVTGSDALKGGQVGYKFYIGENTQRFRGQKDGIRRWLHAMRWDDLRVLQNPQDPPHRRQAEIDNHQEAYPFGYPDIDTFMDFGLGGYGGWLILSFYFFNKDGHEGNNRFRDYTLELKISPLPKPRFKPEPGYDEYLDRMPARARARIRDFRGGVYHRFLVRGGHTYTACLGNNRSFNAICSGVLIDRVPNADPAASIPAGGALRGLREIEAGLSAGNSGPAVPETLLEGYARRLAWIEKVLLAVRDAHPPRYYTEGRRFLVAIVAACDVLGDRFAGLRGLDGVHALRVRSLHELGDFESRDAALDRYVAWWGDRVASGTRGVDDVEEAALAFHRFCAAPWTRGPVEERLFAGLAGVAARSRAPLAETLAVVKRQAFGCRESVVTIAVLNAVRRIPGHGLGGFSKGECLSFVRHLERLGRYEEALELCEASLSKPERVRNDWWTLTMARDMAILLRRDDEAMRYIRRLEEQFPPAKAVPAARAGGGE